MNSPDLVAPKPRINSIDILRGGIMLIMALDHVRDFFHQPAFLPGMDPTNLETTSPAIFFTRWITHYCAPIFVFLSGVSAFISGQKKTKKELSSFLIKRGTWLVIVELVVVTLGLTFNPLYNLFILQVIWAIGWSMIILGLLVRTSYALILAAGLVLFLGHNILDYISLPAEGAASVWWKVWFTGSGSFYALGGNRFVLLAYTILPWTSIMLLGYAFGNIYKNGVSIVQRRKYLLAGGIGLLLLFVVLRLINQYGDPAPWSSQKNGLFTFMSFINVTKYPVSLQYGCMTLGVALILLYLFDQINNRFTGFLSIYGKVPFFYYVLHFFLIHFICVGVFFAAGYGVDQIIDQRTPFLFRPLEFGYPLLVVYPIWLAVILILYYPCRWFVRYKQTHRQWWLSYV